MLNKSIIKIATLIFAGTIFSGCATSIQYQIANENEVHQKHYSPNKFELIDRRSQSEKEAEILSLWATNCMYGIYRLGDDQIVPSRLDVLVEELNKSFGERLINKRVVVNKFEIYNNLQSQLRGEATAGYGLVGAVIRGSGCVTDLDGAENPSRKSSVVVFLDLSIDGKNFREKTVQTLPEGRDFFGSEILTERIRSAVFNSIRNVIAKASGYI